MREPISAHKSRAEANRARKRMTCAMRDVLRALLRANTRGDVMHACHLAIRSQMNPQGLLDCIAIVDAYVIDGHPMLDPRSFVGALAVEACAPENITAGYSERRGAGHTEVKGAAIKEAEARILAHMLRKKERLPGTPWSTGIFPLYGGV